LKIFASRFFFQLPSSPLAMPPSLQPEPMVAAISLRAMLPLRRAITPFRWRSSFALASFDYASRHIRQLSLRHCRTMLVSLFRHVR
jgi:hypothetical protein